MRFKATFTCVSKYFGALDKWLPNCYTVGASYDSMGHTSMPDILRAVTETDSWRGKFGWLCQQCRCFCWHSPPPSLFIESMPKVPRDTCNNKSCIATSELVEENGKQKQFLVSLWVFTYAGMPVTPVCFVCLEGAGKRDFHCFWVTCQTSSITVRLANPQIQAPWLMVARITSCRSHMKVRFQVYMTAK